MRTGENIYHRKDGRWEGRYVKGHDEDGRARYAYIYGRTYQEVKEKRNRCMAERKNQTGPVCRLTAKVLCRQWLDQKRSTVKESSYYRYEQLVTKHVIPALGELRADALTANILSGFVNDKLERGRLDGKGGLSPKTVQDIMIAVKSVMKLAERAYGLPNRAEAVKLPRAEQPEIQVLNDVNLRRLDEKLRAEPNNSNAGIRLCVRVGLRLGEVCALQWSDVDLVNNILYVRKNVRRLPQRDGDSGAKTRLTLTKPKTRQAKREIPLPSDLAEYLRIVAQGQDADAFLVTGKPGQCMDPRTYQYRFQSLLKKLNIAHIPFHGLRHTFATHCVRHGMDIKSLSEILGHATVAMTLNRYVHPSLESKRHEMEQHSFVV